MKVSLARHGGQAAGILLHRPPEVVDTDTLPPPAAAELTRLVAAALPPANAPTTTGEARPGRARDAMSYTITVEDDGHTTDLTQSDTTMSPQFAALLGWLRDHFAQR
ncbi:protealysin inhibitor emfourin [Streptomyces sp. NRRL S-1022]|uniref:protealysin inhibitor emfourin n=1 Tax=Streptomyces sp. NRRL S-1022 TaxID=1463880 RepID=UPI0004C0F41F|nr:protealysin inhibitor emfourin [Streptomyces sp. NRRL S-1022]